MDKKTRKFYLGTHEIKLDYYFDRGEQTFTVKEETELDGVKIKVKYQSADSAGLFKFFTNYGNAHAGRFLERVSQMIN